MVCFQQMQPWRHIAMCSWWCRGGLQPRLQGFTPRGCMLCPHCCTRSRLWLQAHQPTVPETLAGEHMLNLGLNYYSCCVSARGTMYGCLTKAHVMLTPASSQHVNVCVPSGVC
jgi:hypothetical protein